MHLAEVWLQFIPAKDRPSPNFGFGLRRVR